MPKYVSKDGVWYPMKEKVSLTNHSDKPIEYPKGSGKFIQPGEPFIYEGADRASMFELFKAKQETFGMSFFKDPDLIARVRQLGYKSVQDYAKDVGYDSVKVEADFKEHSSVVNMHELPQRVDEIEVMSGGSDTSGSGLDKKGGWTAPPDIR